jgi:hypothetical protein
MSSVIRETVVVNTTGAVLTSALVDAGDDVAEVVVTREFAAADIGAGAGQTRDNANPAGGCLAAQFSGSRIVDIEVSQPYRPGAGAVALFTFNINGVANNTSSVGWKVVYNKNLNISSVYIWDAAAAAPGQLVALDYIVLRIRLGNSANPNLPPLG